VRKIEYLFARALQIILFHERRALRIFLFSQRVNNADAVRLTIMRKVEGGGLYSLVEKLRVETKTSRQESAVTEPNNAEPHWMGDWERERERER